MPIHIPPEATDAAPGAIGSLVATLKYVPGSLAIKLTMWLGGATAAYYGAPMAASLLGIEKATGLAGFALGMFSMAIAAKVYEGITSFDIADFISSIRKRFGV